MDRVTRTLHQINQSLVYVLAEAEKINSCLPPEEQLESLDTSTLTLFPVPNTVTPAVLKPKNEEEMKLLEASIMQAASKIGNILRSPSSPNTSTSTTEH